MAAPPVAIKLRCSSWRQLAQMYKRDLSRSALFLRTSNPPPNGTRLRVEITLPTGTVLKLEGVAHQQIPAGGLGGRGPGVDLKLDQIPQETMWLLESALSATRTEDSAMHVTPRPALKRAVARKKLDDNTVEKQAEVVGHSSVHRISTMARPVTSPLAEDGGEIATAESDLEGAMRQEYSALINLNAFQLLGVGYGTSDEDVRAAFGDLSRRYHPDRYRRYESAEIANIAQEIYILLRDAYQTVSTGDARRKLVAELQARRMKRATDKSAADIAPSPAAVNRTVRFKPPERSPEATPPIGTPVVPVTESEIERADTEYPDAGAAQSGATTADTKRGDPIQMLNAKTVEGEAAVRDIRSQSSSHAPAGPPRPISQSTATVSLLTAFPQAATHLHAGKPRDALKIFEAAARKPDNTLAKAGAELARGMIALDDGDRLTATEHFEVALELDPTNEMAAHELAAMKRRATAQRKGLLSRLMDQNRGGS